MDSYPHEYQDQIPYDNEPQYEDEQFSNHPHPPNYDQNNHPQILNTHLTKGIHHQPVRIILLHVHVKYPRFRHLLHLLREMYHVKMISKKDYMTLVFPTHQCHQCNVLCNSSLLVQVRLVNRLLESISVLCRLSLILKGEFLFGCSFV